MGKAAFALDYTEYRRTKRFAGLDGIRAISAFLVVSVHLADNSLHKRWEWLRGELGVSAFFVLSGFLITALALREEEDRGRLSLGAFFIRRSFRIFPLYYYVLGVTTLLAFAAGGGVADRMTEALPYYLLYMGEFAPSAGFYHSWSLGIEEKFYLLWPLIAFVLLWRKRRWRLPLAMAGAALPMVVPEAANNFIWSGYSRILAGCALALALHEERTYRRLTRVTDAVGPIPAVGTMLALHAAHAWLEEPGGLWRTAHSASVAWVILVCVLYQPRWLGFLDSRPMRFIGERSYGIYLVQLLVIPIPVLLLPVGTGSRLMETLIYLLTFLLCLGLADVFRRVVEKPFITMGRNLSVKALAASERRPELAT